MRIFPSRARALAALLVLIGCGQPIDQAIAVVCSEIARAGSGAAAPTDSAGGTLAPALAIGPADTLALFIVLDSVPPGPGSVRVRVDRLEEPGIVKFFMPPPTAAAAGMAL